MPRLGKFLLLMGSLVVSLGGLEIAVRALHLAPEVEILEVDTPTGEFLSTENPMLPYVPKPGARDISAYGLRDRDYPLDKRAGTYRVVVVGDSVTYGLCSRLRGNIAVDLIFPNLVERQLRDQGWDADAISVSAPGFNTGQELAFFREKGLPLQPDLLVIAYGLNDIQEWQSLEARDFSRLRGYSDSQRLVREISKNTLLHSHVIRAIWYRVTRPPIDVAPITHHRSREQYLAQVSNNLDGFARLSISEGFDVLLVIFPDLHRQRGDTYPDAWQHALVERAARDKGFQTLDLLPVFLKAGQGDLRQLRGRCGVMHPDERGHEVAAASISEHIIAQGHGASPP